MSDNGIIVCEKCGEAQGSTAHLARHLRDMHGWQATLAIQLAKEMRSRYQDADERIRRAAPDLLAACERIAALASGWDKHGALGPREPLSWETVARMAMDYARDAAQKARG